MGGVLCKKCSNKDDDEKVNEENEFNEEGNTSPRLSMLQENSSKQKSEETFTKSIKLKRRKIEIKEKEEKEEKEEKTEYNKSIRYSKTSKDIDKLKFEENEPPKENNNEKKPRRKSKNENKIIFGINNIEMDKKNEAKPKKFARRKKKSSTVKQNQFFFNQLFSAELCVPISQEKLIWENRGNQKNNYKRGNLLGKGAFG